MMREVILRQVWFVQDADDPRPQLWDTKMDAEIYARVCFPDESEDRRYARIYSRDVYTIKHDDAQPLSVEEMVRVLHVRTSHLNSEQPLDKV